MSIADRVRERMESQRITPVEVARRAGLARTFVSDLLHGKKKSVRGEGLMLLSKILECDPEYLTGDQDTPRAPGGALGYASHQGGVPVIGICEAGVWRRSETTAEMGRIPVAPDLRFPTADQRAFLVRGHGASRLGITDGMVVCGIAIGETIGHDTAGAPVVVRSHRPSGEVETSIRLIEIGARGAALVAPSDDERIEPIPFPSADPAHRVEIVAVVTRAIRLFGLPS